MRRFAIVCLILLATAMSASQPAWALPDGGRVTISPGVSYLLFSERSNADDALAYGGGFGFMLNRHWGIEGHLGLTSTSFTVDGPDGIMAGDDTSMRYLGADLRYNFFPDLRFNPYAELGWASFRYDPDGLGNQVTQFGYEAAGGVLMQLRETATQRVSARFEGRMVMIDSSAPIIPSDEWAYNFMATAAIQIEFGDDWHKDTDGDGVIDRIDDCPATGVGVIVDAKGCPIDSDGDGIFDGIDQCDATPVGAVVDSLGCPSDSDADGIFDGIDECPSTPEGAVVDAKGCPLDGDGDRVYDGLDRCPTTPNAVRVDEFGCPTVDSEDERTLYVESLLVVNVDFESGKAELRPGATASFRVIAEALRKWPDLVIEVGGYTDDRGAEETNKQLSQERAEAVANYLVDTFNWIDASQLNAVGYGEVRPIADNNTEEGRDQNRRVEFKVMSGGPDR